MTVSLAADEKMRKAIEAAGLRATFNGRSWRVTGDGVSLLVDRLGRLTPADLVPVYRTVNRHAG